jgi:serine/threonine protein kinase
MKAASASHGLSVESLMAVVAEEFLERLDKGEQPDIEEYARRYPNLATFIRQMLPTLQLLRTPIGDLSLTGASAESSGLRGCLGDYRLVREVGRGGKGVVYEAEQISLGRRVALKILPFAAALDPKQLQRFKNEAQAAAHLHHTNIVPVYSVGSERGVHYYAIQYIEGQTLAKVISDLRLQIADFPKKTWRCDERQSKPGASDSQLAPPDCQSAICPLPSAVPPTCGWARQLVDYRFRVGALSKSGRLDHDR